MEDKEEGIGKAEEGINEIKPTDSIGDEPKDEPKDEPEEESEDKISENKESSTPAEPTKEPNEESNHLAKKLEIKKYNKQITYAIALMLMVFLIMFLVPYVKHEYFDKFTYINLDFQKTQLGELRFYSTTVPVADKETIIGEYTMPFNRNDPRKLDYIEVNTPYEKVLFKKDNKTVFITLDPFMESCEDNGVALSNLAGFLRDFAKFEIQTGLSDEEYASTSDMEFIDCDTYPDNTILSITSGNKTSIRKRKTKEKR